MELLRNYLNIYFKQRLMSENDQSENIINKKNPGLKKSGIYGL
jgi:hypothetical protein